MKKRTLIIITIILLGAILLGVYRHFDTGNENSISINMYFFNDSESTLISKEQTIKFDENDNIINEVLEGLIKGSNNNIGIASKDTKINSITKEERGLIIDFSKEFLTDDVLKNTFSVYATVKTLCQISGVDYVKVTVDSNPVINNNGQEIDFLSGDDINIERDDNSGENKYVTLYFEDEDTNLLKKEIRLIKINDSQTIEQYIVNELIKGPENSNLDNVLSGDTSLISAQTTDGTCFVNFSPSFITKNTGSREKELNAVFSVVNSLTELSNIKSVQFLIDGKKSDKLNKINISKSFVRDESLITKNSNY